MTFKNTLIAYSEKRVLSVFCLGIASGLPWVMIGSALTLWLQERGLSRADIGYSGLIFACFALNFLWSPLVDRITPRLAFLNLSDRQQWIIGCQLIMALCCLTLAGYGSECSAKTVVLIALIISLCAATQDIAIDAYRIDSFAPAEQHYTTLAAGAATAGWWTGYACLGFVPLWLSDRGWSWPQLYGLLGGVVGAILMLSYRLPAPRFRQPARTDLEHQHYCALASTLGACKKLALLCGLFSPFIVAAWATLGSAGMPEHLRKHGAYIPVIIGFGLLLFCATALMLQRWMNSARAVETIEGSVSATDTVLARLSAALIEPLRDFFQRNGHQLALKILLFIFLFKIGEAFLGKMSIVFYKEIGFSNTDIATYSKFLTWWVTVIGALAAGALNARIGLIRGLLISGIAMAGSNLMFAWIALVGPSIPLYIATIVVDGLATAWSLVAFVAFISVLCNHRFSASQYALFASLGALSRTTLSSTSGQLVDWLGGNWSLFFVITALMIIPSLILLFNVSQDSTFTSSNTKYTKRL